MTFELVEGIIASKLQLSIASAGSTPADNMNGGTIVQANGKSIQLYGHAWNSFKLKDAYEFDPYSKFQTMITSGSHVNIFICFSEKENILETQNSNSFCIQVGRSKFIYSTFFGNMQTGGLRIYRMNLARFRIHKKIAFDDNAIKIEFYESVAERDLRLCIV